MLLFPSSWPSILIWIYLQQTQRYADRQTCRRFILERIPINRDEGHGKRRQEIEKKKETKTKTNEWSIFELVISCCLIKRQTYRLLSIDLCYSFLQSISFLTFDFLLGISEQLSATIRKYSRMMRPTVGLLRGKWATVHGLYSLAVLRPCGLRYCCEMYHGDLPHAPKTLKNSVSLCPE